MVIEEVSQSLRNAVAASRAPPESAAFNHEIEPGTGRQNEPAGGGIVCGVSGWLNPPGVGSKRISGRCWGSRRRTGPRCSSMPMRSTFSTVPSRRRRDRPTASSISPSRQEPQPRARDKWLLRGIRTRPSDYADPAGDARPSGVVAEHVGWRTVRRIGSGMAGCTIGPIPTTIRAADEQDKRRTDDRGYRTM